MNRIYNETPFLVVKDDPVPLEVLAKERLGRLLAYWNRKRGGASLPIGASIDPIDLVEHFARLHIL